jgi:hypothetical protein
MLLIHIPLATASKFLHFVVNKLKISEVSDIFLCVENGLDPVILSQITAFVDKIVDFEEKKNKITSQAASLKQYIPLLPDGSSR